MAGIIIAPSLLACKKEDAPTQLSLMQQYGAEWLHFDVMDGVFVPNVTLGSDYLKSLEKYHHMVNDVHLMVTNPLDYIEDFEKAGAKYITFHYESFYDDSERNYMIDEIHAHGMKAGMSVKPNTPVSLVEGFIEKLDLILIMSVEPGFGGQAFLEDTPQKIRKVRRYIDEMGLEGKVKIEVDGGINKDTCEECIAAGADVLVAGSYLFNQDNIGERINILKGRIK